MQRLSLSTVLKLLLAVCAISIISCQEYKIDTQGTFPPKLETDAQSEYTVLAKSPRTIVFNISSNKPWKIESNQNWCVPSPALSSASALIAEITIKVEENPTEQDRTAMLTITAEEVDKQTKITIKQDSKGKLAVQPVDVPLPTAGGTSTFTVVSNKAWTATSSNQWLTLSKSSGTGTGNVENITVTAVTNPGMRRTATVTVSNGLDKTTFDVVQNGIVLTFVNPDKTNFDGGKDNESKTYEVLSNVEYELSTDGNWLTLVKDKDGTHVTATTKTEIYFTSRTAKIKLSPVDKTLGLDPVVLDVKQTGGVYSFDGVGCSADPNTGAVTFNEPTGNSNSRYYVNKRRKLAIHEWTFSKVQVTDNRGLNMNCIEPPKPCWNLFVGLASIANWTFRYRGEGLFDDTVFQPFDVNSLIGFKLEHNYVTPGDRTTANIKIFIKLKGTTEWVKIVETKAYKNGFETDGYEGTIPYFGLISGTGKSGLLTITSYEVTNIK